MSEDRFKRLSNDGLLSVFAKTKSRYDEAVSREIGTPQYRRELEDELNAVRQEIKRRLKEDM